jgi:hypothetical protein
MKQRESHRSAAALKWPGTRVPFISGVTFRFLLIATDARSQALPAGPVIKEIAHRPQRAGVEDMAER